MAKGLRSAKHSRPNWKTCCEPTASMFKSSTQESMGIRPRESFPHGGHRCQRLSEAANLKPRFTLAPVGDASGTLSSIPAGERSERDPHSDHLTADDRDRAALVEPSASDGRPVPAVATSERPGPS